MNEFEKRPRKTPTRTGTLSAYLFVMDGQMGGTNDNPPETCKGPEV